MDTREIGPHSRPVASTAAHTAAIAALGLPANGKVGDAYIGVSSPWAMKPTDAAIQAVKPTGIKTRGYAGLSCDAADSGALINCT